MEKTKEQIILINEALYMIESFGIPVCEMSKRMREKTALNFLALTDMQVGMKWSAAKNITTVQLRTREIIRYVNDNFNENRSSGSYDDVRRKELKPLTLSGIVVNSKPQSAHNDSTRGYGIDVDYCGVIRAYKTSQWIQELEKIIKKKGKFTDRIDLRTVKKVPIKIPNKDQVYLSLGKHNELQRKIIEDMIPIFCHDSDILYLGDTAKKQIINEAEKLKSLNFFKLGHGMLPDIVVYSKKQNLLYLIEAAYTSNPISNNRKIELENITKNCKTNIVFITAFLNKADFRKFISDIAWETEVWLADNPKHMIHFNGDRFLTPYSQLTTVNTEKI